MVDQPKDLTDPVYLAELGRESGRACAEKILRQIDEEGRQGTIVSLPLPNGELSIPFNNTVRDLTVEGKLDWNMAIDRQLVFIDAWFSTMSEKGLA